MVLKSEKHKFKRVCVHACCVSIYIEETEGRGGRREREGVRERGRMGIVILALAEELCECLLAVVGITKVSQTMTKTPVNFESWEDTILHNTN